MKSDNFFADLAKPIDAALRALRDEAEAMDSVSAAVCRKTAIDMLAASEEQLSKAAENKLWVSAYKDVTQALEQLRLAPSPKA